MQPLRIALLTCLVAASASAQDHSAPRLALGDRFLEASAGFSWYSPRASWGLITGRRVYMTGLRGEWVIEAEGRIAWAYTAELVPLAVVERTKRETLRCFPTPTGTLCERDRSAHIAVGTGASPLGLKMYLNRAGKTRLFASAAGGMLAFSSDVPVYNSRRLNYTFEYGGGLELVRRGGGAVILGYKFHHLSNGSSGQVNPGLDANILYVGLRKKRG